MPEDLHVDHLRIQTVSCPRRMPVGCSDCSPSSQYMTCIVGLQKRATRVMDTGGGRGVDLFEMCYVFR